MSMTYRNVSVAVRLFLITVIGVFACSCRDRKSLEVHTSICSELLHTARHVPEQLVLPESQTRAWCNRLIQRTMELKDAHEQKLVASAFADTIKRTKPLSIPHEKWVISLYNYRSAVESCGHLLGQVNCWDEAFELLHGNVTMYREAISRCSRLSRQTDDSQVRQKIEALKTQLQVDLQNFGTVVRHTYLPLVASKKLPKARYEYWKESFNAEFEDVSVLAPTGIWKNKQQ